MTNTTLSPKTTVINVMLAMTEERAVEIKSLWKRYDPEVVIVENAKRVTLNANKCRIAFDSKTLQVFWLIGFAGWKAIECYSPLVIGSAASGQSVADLIPQDHGLPLVERAYKERRAAAQALIEAKNAAQAPWPPDIPPPNPDRNFIQDQQYQVAYDLTLNALAFALFHEFRHVMLDRDDLRPQDRREEELQCDVWARDFMTTKLAKYATDHNHKYYEVLQKRSMGLSLAALILHEITPFWEHGGNEQYFSVASRLQTLLENTRLSANSHFWVFTASLLLGIFRQSHIPIDAPPMNAEALTRYLITKLSI
jgi:hypothetical protein